MQVQQLRLKQFRCFAHREWIFECPLILISGANGSGKTSLLEALHYLCYLRSFRTYTPRELIQFERDTFFLKASCIATDSSPAHEVQVGFAGKKKVVKLNQQVISSYKELSHAYRAITVTEDDLALVQGGPEIRRTFLDQALMIMEPAFAQPLRAYRQVVGNRNALLQRGPADPASYELWTRTAWQQSADIQRKRVDLLATLQEKTNQLLEKHFESSVTIVMSYNPKKMIIGQDYETFCAQNQRLYSQESAMGRSLFGAHLDDFTIQFRHKSSKSFASRGQQKLIVLLIKIAQIQVLAATKGKALFLLDDFMADFDQQTATRLLDMLLALQTQLVFTSPNSSGQFEQLLMAHQAQHIELTH